MNRSICQKLLPLAIALVAMPFSSLAAITTNVSNVAELVDALSFLNSISSSRDNAIILAAGEYDVSEIALTNKYGTVDFSDKNAHLTLNCVTLLGATENPRDTVIFGGGEETGLRVICGYNSTIRNLTVSNGWINAAPGGGYAAHTSKKQGPDKMTEIVSNCIVTCCYAWQNWGGGSAISSVEAYDSEICGNITGETNCFGAADKCNLHRCLIHSNHANGRGGGLGRCYAYDCVISNNTSVKAGAGMSIASNNENYRYLLSGCTVVNNRSSDIGGGVSIDANAPGIVTNTVICGNSAYGQGGGVYGAPCVNCVISNNLVHASTSNNSKGGGVSAAKIIGSDICFNLLETGSGASSGDAYGAGAVASTLIKCNVFGNAISSGYKNMQGAGLYGGGATNCVIYENFIDGSGLGAAMNASCAYGCVFSNNQSRATNRDSSHVRQPTGPVVNCTFIGQTIACSTNIAVVESSRFTGYRDGWTIPAGHNIASMTEDLSSNIPGSDYMASSYIHMRNCLIAGNQIKYISKANSSDLTKFENCTFADNRVNQVFYDYDGDTLSAKAASVVNCIFTRNYDTTGTTRCDLSFKNGTNVSFENCLIGTSRSDDVPYSEIGTVTADNASFNGKSAEHPYEIKYSSPVRGKGKILDWMTAESTDIRGKTDYPRLREGKVDIGCYQCWLNPVGFIMSLK
jgi:hypothetical protein